MKKNLIILAIAAMVVFSISLHANVAQAGNSIVPGDFATIQAAIDDAGTVAGDTITLTAVGHVESNIQVTKSVTIAGSGGATLNPGAGQIGIRPLADNITIRDLLIQGCSQAIRFEDAGGTIDGMTLLRVTMLNCTSRGIEVHNATTVTNLLVDDSTFDMTATGLRVSSSGHLINSEFRDSTFIRLNIGIYEANDGGSSTMKGLLVTGSTFEDIVSAPQGTAIFLEEIQDAVIENNTFIDNRRDIQIFKWYQASVPVSNVIIRNNTMSGTTNAVFAIFNAEHSSGQTEFDGVTFTRNTASTSGGGAVYAGAHDSATGLGGIGWDTVDISCNNFTAASPPTFDTVRFFNPTGVDDQALGGASLKVLNNWWGTADAVTVESLMQIPSITDFTPFLTDVVGDVCPPPPDEDGDGVPDDMDECPETIIPEESVPSKTLGVNRWALMYDDGVFDTTLPKGKGPEKSFTIEDTAGCSCEQIIKEFGLGKGHTKFGCSISAMEDWIEYIQP